jgi:preprotein translocase subunit SecE
MGVMAKVRDEATVSKSTKPASKGFAARSRTVAPFFVNLLKTELYKPNQGWYARVWTGVGLAGLLGAGIWRYHNVSLADASTPMVRLGVPTLLVLLLGWFIFRVLQFPPFVDFLIATEAEMNKISWTSREDLKRATAVVLVTVFLMAVFLFGVDTIWAQMLRLIGVLKFAPATPEG